MKEIKFRAWYKSKNIMIYNAQATYDFTCSGAGCLEEHFQDVINSSNYELMQYTGIKDIHGVEIYEGDIVELKGGRYYLKGAVIYKEKSCRFLIMDSEGVFSKLSWSDIYGFTVEVIGNIHENKELLEEGEKNEIN